MYRKITLAVYYAIFYNLPHSRFLPFTSSVRVWYVSKILNLMPYDKRSKIEHNVYLSNAKGISIGSNCRINENVFIQQATIGNNVLIAPNVAILSISHNHENIDIPIVEQGDTLPNPPIIKDGVWLGRNVVVMPGIVIGEGAIVGSGAVVTKNVAPFTVVGGVPAKLIKNRK
jgi:maltose O-acetyltransferase